MTEPCPEPGDIESPKITTVMETTTRLLETLRMPFTPKYAAQESDIDLVLSTSLTALWR
jgi:hypothetical protein